MYLNNASTIAMGDEFDGFVDENYERELIYLIDIFVACYCFVDSKLIMIFQHLNYIYGTFIEQPNQILSATHHARNL